MSKSATLEQQYLTPASQSTPGSHHPCMPISQPLQSTASPPLPNLMPQEDNNINDKTKYLSYSSPINLDLAKAKLRHVIHRRQRSSSLTVTESAFLETLLNNDYEAICTNINSKSIIQEDEKSPRSHLCDDKDKFGSENGKSFDSNSVVSALESASTWAFGTRAPTSSSFIPLIKNNLSLNLYDCPIWKRCRQIENAAQALNDTELFFEDNSPTAVTTKIRLSSNSNGKNQYEHDHQIHLRSNITSTSAITEEKSANVQTSPKGNLLAARKNQDEQLRRERLWRAFEDGTVTRRRQLMQLSTSPIPEISTGLVLNETMIKPKVLSIVTKPSLLSRTARCSSCSSPRVVGLYPQRCDLIASQSTENHVEPPQPQFKPQTAPQLPPKLTSRRFSTSILSKDRSVRSRRRNKSWAAAKAILGNDHTDSQHLAMDTLINDNVIAKSSESHRKKDLTMSIQAFQASVEDQMPPETNVTESSNNKSGNTYHHQAPYHQPRHGYNQSCGSYSYSGSINKRYTLGVESISQQPLVVQPKSHLDLLCHIRNSSLPFEGEGFEILPSCTHSIGGVAAHQRGNSISSFPHRGGSVSGGSSSSCVVTDGPLFRQHVRNNSFRQVSLSALKSLSHKQQLHHNHQRRHSRTLSLASWASMDSSVASGGGDISGNAHSLAKVSDPFALMLRDAVGSVNDKNYCHTINDSAILPCTYQASKSDAISHQVLHKDKNEQPIPVAMISVNQQAKQKHYQEQSCHPATLTVLTHPNDLSFEISMHEPQDEPKTILLHQQQENLPSVTSTNSCSTSYMNQILSQSQGMLGGGCIGCSNTPVITNDTMVSNSRIPASHSYCGVDIANAGFGDVISPSSSPLHFNIVGLNCEENASPLSTESVETFPINWNDGNGNNNDTCQINEKVDTYPSSVPCDTTESDESARSITTKLRRWFFDPPGFSNLPHSMSSNLSVKTTNYSNIGQSSADFIHSPTTSAAEPLHISNILRNDALCTANPKGSHALPQADTIRTSRMDHSIPSLTIPELPQPNADVDEEEMDSVAMTEGTELDQAYVVDTWDMLEQHNHDILQSHCGDYHGNDCRNIYSTTAAPIPFRILGTSASDTSSHPHVLSPPLMESLEEFVSTAASHQNFWMKYSLVRDGANISTLLKNIRGAKHTIIAIETVKGDVFGSFTSSPWRMTGHSTSHFGSGEAFVWRMRQNRMDIHNTCQNPTNPKCSKKRDPDAFTNSLLEQVQMESEIEVFPWSGLNNVVQICKPGKIAVGGGSSNIEGGTQNHGSFMSDFNGIANKNIGEDGEDSNQYNNHQKEGDQYGFAFAIDSDLQYGTSSLCATFNSPGLTQRAGQKNKLGDDETFEIANLECWAFTPFDSEEEAQEHLLHRIFLEDNTYNNSS